MELTCPKCQAPMRSYERSGVTVDQCTECRGIFLDRGELERLVDADTRFHGDERAGQPAPQAAPGYPVQPPAQPHGGQQYQQHSGHRPHKKRKSFFEELFD